MKLHEGECYKNTGEVYVEALAQDRVEYREVWGWSYGWPSLGTRHSTTRANFEALYPEHIEYVQAF